MPELTPLEWVANIIGAAGYLLFSLSPLARSRTRYLVLHGIAMLPIAAHYLMLSAVPGAVLSLVYLGADLVGVKWPGKRLPLLALTTGALAAFAASYEGAGDYLGLAGTLIFVLSRAVTGHMATLAVAAVSTITWGAYGYIEHSWSQVGFSGAYALFCLVGLWRLRRENAA